MERSSSPLHLHIGRNAPVHVHVSPKKKMTTSQRLAKSFAEMSAGRPSLRATDHLRSNGHRMGAQEFVASSTPQGPWVPPPGKTARSTMTWKSPSHRLEITPAMDDGDTVLTVGDLGSDGSGSARIVVENGGKQKLRREVKTLATEVNSLRAEVDLDRSLHEEELKDKQDELNQSRRSLRRKEVELRDLKDQLEESQVDKLKLRGALSVLKEDADNNTHTAHQLESQRELLMKKLVEAEMDGTAMSKQVDTLKRTLRKIEREKYSTTVQVSELSKHKDLLLDKLAEFDSTNQSLRKMLRSQQNVESSLEQLSVQKDLLLSKLSEADRGNARLKQQLLDKEAEVAQKEHLKGSLMAKEMECETMAVKVQALEGQLRQTNDEFSELQAGVDELQRQSVRDREAVKRMTKHQREESTHHQDAVDKMESRLEDTQSELGHMRTRNNKLSKEKARLEAEVGALSAKVSQLEGMIREARETSKLSLEAVNARLVEKTRELNVAQIENEKLKASLTCTDEKLQSVETSSQSQTAALKAEVSQLRASVAQYESLTAEYRSQVDKLHSECSEVRRQLQQQEQETERAKQEGFIETERVRIKLQQQLSELGPVEEALKTAEAQLKNAKERLFEQENRLAGQTKLIAELTLKAEQHSDSMEDIREKYRSLSAEKAYLQSRLEDTDKRLQEADHQNRDLVSIAGKKEERIHHLEGRLEELSGESTSLKRTAEQSAEDARRHSDQLKDRAAAKERANLSRIADLESQLTRANLSLSQMRKTKEEAERRHTSRMTEMKERYEQANNAHKSLQNYVSLLKSSYVNMFSDLGTSPSKYTS